MAITPETNLKLLYVPLQLDYKNQVTFANKDAQYNFFNNLEGLEEENFSYQRKDNIIRFPAHIDSIIKYNYCMYKNSNYSNKWFYCFITNMKYLNDNCTEITIETDVFQTWQFDIIYMQSFIEREMIAVSDDVPGANLLPEGLEIGEPKISGSADFDDLEPRYIVAFTGDNLGISPVPQEGFSYNGIFSSVTFILAFNQAGLSNLLSDINESQQGDKILTVFSIPHFAVKNLEVEATSPKGYYVIKENFLQLPITKTLLSTPTTIDSYTPKNKKLLTYPYLYLGFNPPNGSSKIYRYEDFNEGLPKFKLISEINPNPEVIFIPQDYRGQSGDSLVDKSSLNGYPTISYKNDVFNSWLAKNSEIISIDMAQKEFNYDVGLINNLGGLISNSLSSNISGSVNSATSLISDSQNYDFNIQRQMAQIEAQSLMPNQATLSSSNATLLGYEMIGKNIFTRYNIKRQFAERIDKFFDMFGYLTNTFKVPNINNRPNWNYVKTIGLNAEGFIPQEDMQKIKHIFDSGITLWHNPATFLDYNQNNR